MRTQFTCPNYDGLLIKKQPNKYFDRLAGRLSSLCADNTVVADVVAVVVLLLLMVVLTSTST